MKYHYLIVGFTDCVDPPFIQERGIVERSSPTEAIRAVVRIHTDLYTGQTFTSGPRNLGRGSYEASVNVIDGSGKPDNLGVTVLLQQIK